MSWINRLIGSLRKDKLDEHLDDELRFHIEMRTQEFVAAGMQPEEARRHALRLFGNQMLLKESAHAERHYIYDRRRDSAEFPLPRQEFPAC